MLKWLGSTQGPILRLDSLFEAKTPIGMVKFHKVNGVEKQAWVKTTNDPGAHKAGWIYWIQVTDAKAHGIYDGSIVTVTKGKKPLKPGDYNPDTGKPAPPAIPPPGMAAPAASGAEAEPTAAKTASGPEAPAPQAPPPEASAPQNPAGMTSVEPEAPVSAPPPSPEVEPAEPAEPEAPADSQPADAPPPETEPAPEPAAAPTEKQPPVVAPAVATGAQKPLPKLKPKLPLGTVRYHAVKAGEPAKQVLMRVTDDPEAPRGGWVYLMTANAAAKAGIHHGDILSFTFTPDATVKGKGKIELHKDKDGKVKKLQAVSAPTPGDIPAEAPQANAGPVADIPAAPEPPSEQPAVPPESQQAEPPSEEPAAAASEPPPAPAEPAPTAPPELSAPPNATLKDAPLTVAPESLADLLSLLKKIPGFEQNPEDFLTVAGSPSSLDKSLKLKYGLDWFDQWKKAKGGASSAAPTAASDDSAAPVKPVKPTTYAKLPASIKKVLQKLWILPGTPEALVIGALHGMPDADLTAIQGALPASKKASVAKALQSLVDTGVVVPGASGAFSLATDWSAVGVPSGATGVKLPKKASPALQGAFDALGLEATSPTVAVLKLLDAHPNLDAASIQKAAGFTSYGLALTLQHMVSEKLLTLSNGSYVLGDKLQQVLQGQDAAKQAAAVAPPAPSPDVAVPAGKMLTLPPAALPDASQLKYLKSGNALGGAGQKEIYADVDGNEWLFKLAKEKATGGNEKPFAAHVQEAFSTIAQKVKSVHIPLKVMHLKGKLGTLQPMVPNNGTLMNVPCSTLTPLEAEDVASEHLLDWMMSQHDSFGANLLRTKTGRVLGIDKEQGFRFFETDKLSTSYSPNSIHGTPPPYYNQFWKEWSEKKFNFDPTVLKKYLDAIDQLDDAEYGKALKPYAESFWEEKPAKQKEFLQAAVARKNSVRKDFESFLTGLYKTRTGLTDGEFTFTSGWVPGVKGVPGKTVKHKYYAETMVGEYSLSTKPYVPLQGPDKGKPDPTKIAVKAPSGNEGVAKLSDFMTELKLTPFVPDYSKGVANANGVIPGNAYSWAFFNKPDWDAAHVEKTEKVGLKVAPTSPQPQYQPELQDSPEVHSNLHELDGLHKEALPALGKRLTLDGPSVEGQFARAKKFRDKHGKDYYLFQFKLRKNVWSGLHSGAPANWAFPLAKWDPKDHLFEETANHSDTVPARKWESDKSELYLANTDGKWTYMGSMYAKVRPKPGQTPAQALRDLLDVVKPGFADAILTPPTPEEREVVKLSRVLWSVAPQISDKLPESERTITNLKKVLKAQGYGESELSGLKEVEAFPGYATWTKPGRYKALGNGEFKYLFNGISDTDAALSIMRFGLMGIHERNLSGIQPFGGSYTADVQSGSGDGILARIVTESGFGYNFSTHAFKGKYQALIAPTEADRLDTYMHMTDHFGRCRSDAPEWKNRNTIENCVAQQANNYNPGAEMSFRKGIGRGKLLRIVCGSEDARKELILNAKQQGILQVNGVPVDDFVVVCTNLGEAYKKYVKPLGF